MHHTQSLDDLAFQRSFEALGHLGVGTAKFHETLTTAWVLALQHFMALSSPASSAEACHRINARLLDSSIMLKHYSAERLFSQAARQAYVQPDLAAIPEPQ
jgi:hypothetical protein